MGRAQGQMLPGPDTVARKMVYYEGTDTLYGGYALCRGEYAYHLPGVAAQIVHDRRQRLLSGREHRQSIRPPLAVRQLRELVYVHRLVHLRL